MPQWGLLLLITKQITIKGKAQQFHERPRIQVNNMITRIKKYFRYIYIMSITGH